MKSLCFSALAFCFASISQAGSLVYSCENANVKVSYVDSVSRGGGHKVLTFSEGGGTSHRSEAPIIEQTIFGQVVSMSYDTPHADSLERYASLVLPHMNLLSLSSRFEFTTVLVLTEKMSSASKPEHVDGIVDQTRHQLVFCTASVAS